MGTTDMADMFVRYRRALDIFARHGHAIYLWNRRQYGGKYVVDVLLVSAARIFGRSKYFARYARYGPLDRQPIIFFDKYGGAANISHKIWRGFNI
jgi:hypothetical protein